MVVQALAPVDGCRAFYCEFIMPTTIPATCYREQKNNPGGRSSNYHIRNEQDQLVFLDPEGTSDKTGLPDGTKQQHN
jgi:hypothetical protein